MARKWRMKPRKSVMELTVEWGREKMVYKLTVPRCNFTFFFSWRKCTRSIGMCDERLSYDALIGGGGREFFDMGIKNKIQLPILADPWRESELLRRVN